jgi:hypothetical protein
MEYERLQRTNYPDRPERTHTDQTHFQDFRDYHLSLARMHHAHLHGGGIARGLEVRGALGDDTVVVQPGVAVDALGHLIILTQEVSLITSNFLTSALYVTLTFAEAPGQDGRLAQVPEVRLQTVSAVEDGGTQTLVVLGLVETDGNGLVVALKERDNGRQFRRQLRGGQFEALEIQRSAQVGEQNRQVAAVPAGKIAAGEHGGLRVTVPTQSDEMLMAREDDGMFAQLELRADSVVMPGNLGLGTSQPREKLEVNGNITISSTALSQTGRIGIDNLGLWLEPSAATSGIRLQANPSLIGLYVRGTDGNVAIGHHTPQEKLDVDGRIKSGALSIGPWPANSRYLFFGVNTLDQTQAGNYALLQGSTSEPGRTFLNSPVDIRFRINNADQLVLNSSGLFGAAKGPGGSQLRIAVGRTQPNQWVQYSSNGIYVDVVTAEAGFTQTPFYITSLSGNSNHWVVRGSSSIYDSSPRGCRVYIYYDGITVASATSWGWYINWLAIGQ